MVKPFTVDIDESTVRDVYQRVASHRWGYMPKGGDWQYGTNLEYLRSLTEYWLTEYDWPSQQIRLNQYPQYTTLISGMNIHYIHVKGSGGTARPLLLTHGWPGSIVEFMNIIEPLAHPERFGGNEADAFDIVAPSLPGFGFSDRPPKPMGPRAMAAVLNTLMTDVLEYDAYFAQGGDWGSAICSWMGYDHDVACRGIHINFPTMRSVDGPQTSEEREWEKQVARDQVIEDGYRTIQATKPQTLSYAMSDSPVGVAAWIIEKFHSWSDLRAASLDEVYSRDDLLTNIMVYVVTESFNSASWIYYGRREEGGRVLNGDGGRVEVPCGMAIFPEDSLTWPPRSYYERLYNVQHWTEMSEGGHFAALEQPVRLVRDIRAFFRAVVL